MRISCCTITFHSAPLPPIPQIAFIILASTIPIGMPVVTGAVLAVGAREMVAEKAIVTR